MCNLPARPQTYPASGEQLRHQRSRARVLLVSADARADAARIHSGEKARAARRTNLVLAVSVRECDPFPHEPVEVRGVNMRVVERADGVETLLVSAEP